jgi:hypothetical protein
MLLWCWAKLDTIAPRGYSTVHLRLCVAHVEYVGDMHAMLLYPQEPELAAGVLLLLQSPRLLQGGVCPNDRPPALAASLPMLGSVAAWPL